MKFTMNPSRAYILGMWKSRRTKEGIGVEGSDDLCQVFLKACLDEKLCTPGKVKFLEEDGRSKCFFYNSAMRAWLDSEIDKREGRLKYKNDFAAGYFAGLFDAKGGWGQAGKKEIPFVFGDRTDEIVLLRLGFRAKRERAKIAIISEDFYDWVKPYLKLEISKVW